jgi:hypothetical protein
VEGAPSGGVGDDGVDGEDVEGDVVGPEPGSGETPGRGVVVPV